MSMALTPRILPGALHATNRTACDWGWQGLLAYGCQNFVVVIDSKTVQVIQTVHHSLAPICQIKWSQEHYYHDLHSPYHLRLAAGNTNGHVMIWDIQEGTLLNDFVEMNKQPLCMEWLKGHDVSHDLLLVLYASSVLILWNADTGIKLWKKQFQENILSVTVDPFNPSNMAAMSTDWVMLITDLSVTQAPSEKGRKFYLSSTSPPGSSSSLSSGNLLPTKSNTSKSTFQKVKSYVDDLRGRNEDGSENSCDCVTAVYLPSNRNHLLLLFAREILILDVEIGQALGSFSIESTSPSFYNVIPCRQRDVLYLLHENGSISMRAVRSPESVPYQNSDDPEQMLSSRISLDIIYDMKCHSDVFRLSRMSRLMAFAVNPVSEYETAIVLGDGRILFWSLAPPSGSRTFENISTAKEPLPFLQETVRTVKGDSNTLCEMVPPLLTFGDNSMKQRFHKPKFLLSGLFECVALNPICCRMCPPMTTKNFKFYKPLLAVGCGNGVLQIFNVSEGYMVKQLAMTLHSIKGLEWLSLTSLIVYFNGSSLSDKSEIVFVDITCGSLKTLPSSRGLKDSTIASLKASHLKQYILILYKNTHAELWDAVNLCQLREFPVKFPKITSFEWSPSNYGSRLGKRKAKSSDGGNSGSSTAASAASTPNLDESTTNVLEAISKDEKKTPSKVKEHLVFTDGDGTVYHYMVEGTSLKDGSKVPPESGMSAICCITWKSDMLVLGDVDGNLNLWDLKGKVSRVFPTHRGAVKRMKFAPGKGNMRMLMLLNDGVEVWDTVEARILASIKTSKEQVSILDAEWLSSTLPLLLLSDGSVRVLDQALKSSNSAISDKEFGESVFNPRLTDLTASLKLKHILQHQPWREKYNAEHFSEDRDQRPVQDVLKLIPSELADRLYDCPLGTAQRCSYVSEIFGDESDWIFWNVALHYLEREKYRMNCGKHQKESHEDDSFHAVLSSLSSSNSIDLLLSDPEEISEEVKEVKPCTCLKSSLDTHFDILCDNSFYKKLQLYRIALRDSHRSSYEHTCACAEKLILAGEMERAVQVLLEGEPTDKSYYTDALRACLIATVKSTGASQSTIKLVATNLIASGKISEGVELLCLVDKGTDACRYLQTYSKWEAATWLAKVRLNHHECSEVISRWCDQLCSSHMNKKVYAILVLLSIGKFTKALEIMFSLGQIDRAVLFLESCFEFQIFSRTDNVNQILYENIYLDYARLQFKLNHKEAAKYYCEKAGGRGRKLMEDHEKGTLHL